jgi:hypothetical protein
MWLERDDQQWAQPWPSPDRTMQIEANYRRGVLRAKVNIQHLTGQTASVDCMDKPQAGTLVWLTLPGLEARAALVERCEGFRMMLRFTQPFHPAVLDAFLGGRIRAC